MLVDENGHMFHEPNSSTNEEYPHDYSEHEGPEHVLYYAALISTPIAHLLEFGHDPREWLARIADDRSQQ